MSDEATDSPEVIETPAEAQTAPTEQETTPEPVNDDTADSTEEKKPSRAEERIQQLVGDRNAAMDFAKMAEQQRDFYKQQLDTAPPKTEPVKPLAMPRMEDHDHDTEKWSEAVTAWAAQTIDQTVSTQVAQGLAGIQKQAAQTAQDADWTANVAEFKEANPDVDFDTVAFATKDIYSIIKGQENGPEIAVYLGQNPVEAQRIGMLPASQQAFALGKIKLSPGKPSAKSKTTQAPEPPNPVGGQQPSTSIPKDESMNDYVARRRTEMRSKKRG